MKTVYVDITDEMAKQAVISYTKGINRSVVSVEPNERAITSMRGALRIALKGILGENGDPSGTWMQAYCSTCYLQFQYWLKDGDRLRQVCNKCIGVKQYHIRTE